MSWKTAAAEAEAEYGAGGGSGFFFKFKDGSNKVRIIAGGTPIALHGFGKGKAPKTCFGKDKGCPYHGDNAPVNEKGEPQKPQFKAAVYLLDQTVENPTIQFTKLPSTVHKVLVAFMDDPDWNWSELPMPYDIRVNYDKNLPPNEMYKVLPVPAQSSKPISEEILTKLTKMKTTDELVKEEKDKARKEYLGSGTATAAPTSEIDLDEPPVGGEEKEEEIPF